MNVPAASGPSLTRSPSNCSTSRNSTMTPDAWTRRMCTATTPGNSSRCVSQANPPLTAAERLDPVPCVVRLGWVVEQGGQLGFVARIERSHAGLEVRRHHARVHGRRRCTRCGQVGAPSHGTDHEGPDDSAQERGEPPSPGRAMQRRSHGYTSPLLSDGHLRGSEDAEDEPKGTALPAVNYELPAPAARM